jgi:uridine kinase
MVVWLEVGDVERVRRMAAGEGVAADPDHDDQRRYLDAQRLYRDTVDPARSADLVVDNTDPDRPTLAGRPVVPPGWHRTPHGLRRVVTTDRETAERINRLLGGG